MATNTEMCNMPMPNITKRATSKIISMKSEIMITPPFRRFRLGSTAKFYIFDDGRYKFEGTHVQVPTSDDTPSTNAANSKGGIWLDTSEDPPVLRYHDGYQWKTLATT